MIGILLLTHGALGVQFITTARLIGLTSEEAVTALSADPSESPDVLLDKLAQAIKAANRGDGVLILTDLFGGTPTNLSLSFLEEGKVEVVTGLNLPMVIKAINSREDQDLKSLAKSAAEAGKESIFLAGDILRQRLARKRSHEKPA
jgi:mannose PTS system EIIA component